MIGELLPRSALGAADVSEMYRLFSAHFDHVSESRFRLDLEQKHWIIRIRDHDGLHGFTSLRFFSTRHAGETLNVIYSGDTIVAPEARRSTILARTWIDSVKRLREHYQAADLRWLLLVSGFRTYRLLPVFWKDFYPHHARPTPARIRDEMDSLSRALFDEQYRAAEGIVRFDEPQALRPELGGIPASRLADPHVRFFAASNPGHVRGDELVCWTRLAHDNLTRAGARMWHAGDPAERDQLIQDGVRLAPGAQVNV